MPVDTTTVVLYVTSFGWLDVFVERYLRMIARERHCMRLYEGSDGRVEACRAWSWTLELGAGTSAGLLEELEEVGLQNVRAAVERRQDVQ